MGQVINKHKRSDWSFENNDHLIQRFSVLSNSTLNNPLPKIFWLRDKLSEVNFTNIRHQINRGLGFTGHYSTDNYTYNYLYYCNQLSKAFFQYSLADGQPVRIQIADKTIETIGKFSPNDNETGAMNVVRGIELALILRDKEALQFYPTIPFEFTEKAQHDDIIAEIMLIFFNMLAQNTADVAAAATTFQQIQDHLQWEEYKKYVRYTSFLNESMWRYLFGHRQEKVEFLYLPLLKVYFFILENKQAEFEEAVYEALQQWQQYYTKKYVEQGEEFDRSFEPEGYWCIPMIAACAFAHDSGMKLANIESDYLCDWMIEGRFEGFELLVKGDEKIK